MSLLTRMSLLKRRLEDRIVDVGLGDRRPQVVEDEPSGDTVKKGEGIFQPADQILELLRARDVDVLGAGCGPAKTAVLDREPVQRAVRYLNALTGEQAVDRCKSAFNNARTERLIGFLLAGVFMLIGLGLLYLGWSVYS